MVPTINSDHGWPCFEKWHHSQSWLTMVDHAFEKWLHHGHDDHGWPWSWWPWLTMVMVTMVDHGHGDHGWPHFEKWHHSQPWLTMVTVTMVEHAFEKWHHVHGDHGWPWSWWPWLTMVMVTMVDHGQAMVSDRSTISQSAVNHGWTMVKSHGWPWLTMLLRNGYTMVMMTMVDHGHGDHGWPCFWEMAPRLWWPWLTMVKPWFLTVVPFLKVQSTMVGPWSNPMVWPWSTMVKPWFFSWGYAFKACISSRLCIYKKQNKTKQKLASSYVFLFCFVCLFVCFFFHIFWSMIPIFKKWYQTWDDQLLYSQENGIRWDVTLYKKSMESVSGVIPILTFQTIQAQVIYMYLETLAFFFCPFIYFVMKHSFCSHKCRP